MTFPIFGLSAINHFILRLTRTQLPEGIDLHYIEIAYLHTDGLICCCRSHRDISRNKRLFHIQLEVPCIGALMSLTIHEQTEASLFSTFYLLLTNIYQVRSLPCRWNQYAKTLHQWFLYCSCLQPFWDLLFLQQQ